MTGKRVLTPKLPTDPGPAQINAALDSALSSTGPLTVKLDTKDVISKLQQVAAKLQHAKKLNDQLQAQFHAGSATWHQCESIDDTLHEITVLLGE